MKIWLPSAEIGITVDTSQDDEARCAVQAQRFTMTLQPLKTERGFGPPDKEKEE